MSDLRSRFFAICDDLLCTASTDGFFLELNHTWERVLGWSPEELRSAPIISFIEPADREATLAAMARLAGGSDLIHFRNRYRKKDGAYVTLDWASAAPHGPGEPICALARVVASPDAADLDAAALSEIRREALRAAVSTPIIQVWDDVLTMPVVGLVDSVRAADMKTALLAAVSRTGAKFAIIDLTGVDVVDTATADHLLRVMRAVHLLGARCVVTGIQPSVAQIIVGLGLGLPGVVTLRSLREGLRHCLRDLGYAVQRDEDPALKRTLAEARPGGLTRA
jgi:rsbT co-antagonist protein RsbR